MNLTLPQRMYLLCHTVDKEEFEAVNLQGPRATSARYELANQRVTLRLDGQLLHVVHDGVLADPPRPDQP
ncbi:hypothetical protein AB0I98_31395 [Streptomyces sp. NPDC050211]|jgi:hypothetical protein|uniref:hypothetical protein n=1 Tax=Streptomyces sp. NPDC050211 TaxID=3154932 RepID=UPI0034372BCA